MPAELTDIVAAPGATRWPRVVEATRSAGQFTVAVSCVITPLVGLLVPVNVSGMLSAGPPATRVNVAPAAGGCMTTLGGGSVDATVKVVAVVTEMPELIAVATRACAPTVTPGSVPVLVAVAVPRPEMPPMTTGAG